MELKPEERRGKKNKQQCNALNGVLFVAVKNVYTFLKFEICASAWRVDMTFCRYVHMVLYGRLCHGDAM